jgi:hypothetical protein
MNGLPSGITSLMLTQNIEPTMLYPRPSQRRLSMTHQFSIPVAESYLSALGRATYNFAYLEWAIISLGQMLHQDFVSSVEEMTAGKMAQTFEDFVKALPSMDPDRSRLKTLAKDFRKNLVDRRNKLMHGKPFTADNGEQRLRYSGKKGVQIWEHDDILGVAKDFDYAANQAVNIRDERQKRTP